MRDPGLEQRGACSTAATPRHHHTGATPSQGTGEAGALWRTHRGLQIGEQPPNRRWSDDEEAIKAMTLLTNEPVMSRKPISPSKA